MSKKVKILISTLLVAALLTIGATATVLAEGEDEDTTTVTEEETEEGFLNRVAEILGIDETDLTAAFKQAQQEMKEEAFINRLNQAVEEGRITQEQADEIIEWWQQRPDDAIKEWWEQRPEAMMEPGLFKHIPTLRSRAIPKFQMQNRSHLQNSLGGWFFPGASGHTD